MLWVMQDTAPEFTPVSAEVHDLHLTRDRWQQIYHLSKAARDYNAFAAHLEGAHLLPAPSSSHSAHREGWTLAEPQVSPDTVPVKSWSAHGAEPRQAAAHTGIPAAYTAPRAGTEADAPTIAPAAVLAPANDSHPALTREWVWQHSRESLVIVTTSNFHFIDFVENWALHLANHRALRAPCSTHALRNALRPCLSHDALRLPCHRAPTPGH